MEPEQVAGIVKSLTKAQRKAVSYRPEYGETFGTIYANRSTLAVLDRLGLIAQKEGGWAYLSEHGLAVRSALKENDRGE